MASAAQQAARMDSLRQIEQTLSVYREGWEKIAQPFYDHQAYPQAGASVLTFFALGVGQGSTPKTIEDTNMTLNGQLPTGQMFIVDGIEVDFDPNSNIYTHGAAAASGADAADDSRKVYSNGVLQMVVGTKYYQQIAPLGKAPASWRMFGWSAIADTTTAGAGQDSTALYAKAQGKPLDLIPFIIPQNANFNVTVSFPNGVQAITSTTARMGVFLNGVLLRRSQ